MSSPGLVLAGFTPRFLGGRLYVLGETEIAYLSTLDAAEEAGAESVSVIDQETGTIYRASLAHIRRAGFEFNRGYGEQWALPLSGWLITRRGEIPARQLELWRGGV